MSMSKNIKNTSDVTDHNKRLQEIAVFKLGDLSDDEVLRLLAERKQLEVLQRQYEKLQKEEEERQLLEKKKIEERQQRKQKIETLLQEIETLNQSITPSKGDDELLSLVTQRKELEKELETLGVDVPQSSSHPVPAAMPETMRVEAPSHNKEEARDEQEAFIPVSDTKIAESPHVVEATPTPSHFRQSLTEAFGKEEIVPNTFEEGSTLKRYLDQLKNNAGSLGTLLQEMPLDAKRNKAFMLKVAEIDSAYAMHYADKELKTNEDFNIRIASMPNNRNSGNAVAEMLPEARTPAVVLAAVKQDAQNIKFAQPNMEAYDEMIRIAKQKTIETITRFKDAADVMLLIPRLLQKDKQFMLDVESIITKKETDGV